jgi:alanyl-tRNA synthetase
MPRCHRAQPHATHILHAARSVLGKHVTGRFLVSPERLRFDSRIFAGRPDTLAQIELSSTTDLRHVTQIEEMAAEAFQ